MNNNTIIKNTELPLFLSSSNIGGNHITIFDNSTEFSWTHWLFDTIDNSRDESIVKVCDLSFHRDFLEVNEDMEPLHLTILEDDFDESIIYEASRITITNRLLEIETNNKDEDSGGSDPLYPVALKINFNNWKELDDHGLEYGFAFMITYSKKDKKDGIPHHYVYTYMKDQKYISRKEAHIVEGHNKGHYAENCKFYINTYH
ncbi:30163_t:CDS:2 [Gigaspora margarita]|uniref:30163_t:CDS:1 n=1 Tax=Gigaspora margarita TaxID=4874 RepID=A0ABN7USN5_GIGMA|nr:30163_t:CDS:2 [Gigaspora margarita]